MEGPKISPRYVPITGLSSHSDPQLVRPHCRSTFYGASRILLVRASGMVHLSCNNFINCLHYQPATVGGSCLVEWHPNAAAFWPLRLVSLLGSSHLSIQVVEISHDADCVPRKDVEHRETLVLRSCARYWEISRKKDRQVEMFMKLDR